MSRLEPPRLAQALLRRLAPHWAREDLIGDLFEGYSQRRAGRGRLWADVWSFKEAAVVPARYLRHYRRGFQLRRTLTGAGPGLWAMDATSTLRSLRRSPAFTLPAVFSLAIGVGATAAVLNLAYAVFFQPLPFEDEDRLVVIEHRSLGSASPAWKISYPELEDYREINAFSGVASHYTVLGTILGLGAADRDFVASVSPNYFRVLGVRPALGRLFQPADGDESVAVLSHEYWSQRLGRDPNVLGRSFRLDGQPYVVVGVAPPLPDFPNRDALFVSAPSTPRFRQWVADRTIRPLTGIARLRTGIQLDTAEKQLAGLTSRIVDAYPEAYPIDLGLDASLVRIRDGMVRESRRTLLVLSAAAAAVLVLVMANLTFLALARTMKSELEIRIRATLGATRFQILRHRLTEGLWISLAGGILGTLVAFGLAEILEGWASSAAPHVSRLPFGATTGAAVLVLSLGIGIVGTTLPLWLRLPQIVGGTRSVGNSRATTSAGWLRLQRGLIITQVALSVALVSATILLGKTLVSLRHVDKGFSAESVMTMRVALNASYRGEHLDRSLTFYEELLRRIDGLPGVVSSAIARDVPLFGGPDRSQAFSLPGWTEVQNPPIADLRIVSVSYFKTLGHRVTRGRAFLESDAGDSPPIAMVNETFADRFWPGSEALGKTFTTSRGQEVSVVGIVADLHHRSLDEPAVPEYYLPLRQNPLFGWHLFVRGTGDAETLVRPVTSLVRELDPEIPLHMIHSLESVVDRGLAPPVFRAQLVGLFGVVGLGLTCIAVLGLTAFTVTSRLKEFGIRLALGAKPSSVVGLVVGQTMAVVGVGVVCGLFIALAFQSILTDLLFSVSVLEPMGWAAPSIVVLTTAFLAALIPARSAAQADPLTSLRG